MPHGTVKFFNAGKGFGFVTRSEDAKDVFLPATSIVAAGISALKTGQRVSFDEVKDAKGPKAVNLIILEERATSKDTQIFSHAAPKSGQSLPVTLFCDLSLAESEEVLAELRAGGCDPLVVDYMATPPSREKLKEVSSLLQSNDQSLVRKYDHLFSELRLDDRFISENELWDAVVEHPSLINGPVLATATRANICRSRNAVRAFLTSSPVTAKPKSLPPGLLKFMLGQVSTPPVVQIQNGSAAENVSGGIKSTDIAVVKKSNGVRLEKAGAEPKSTAEAGENIKIKTALKTKRVPNVIVAKSKKNTPAPSTKPKNATKARKAPKPGGTNKAPPRKPAKKSRRK